MKKKILDDLHDNPVIADKAGDARLRRETADKITPDSFEFTKLARAHADHRQLLSTGRQGVGSNTLMGKKPLRILLIEDNLADARLLREMFSKEQPDSFEFIHFLRLGEALDHLAKGAVDIVLLDMGLPDAHGLDTVRRTHSVAQNVPVIVLTGLDDEAVAADAMKEGAQDYLIKGQIENRALPRALRYAIERHRMQAEADIIRTNQLQFKDEFLSHVSHELRSPLTAVYQFVSILFDRLAGEVNAEQHQYLEIVLRNVKQLESMINDLLEVTRVQAGKLMIEPQCTSVVDAIDYTIDTLQIAAVTKGVVLTSDINVDLPLVCADPARLRQTLIILVDNAIKFTPANGTVQIQARVFEQDSKFLLLEVADSGCGIDTDMSERIFERLVQASDLASAGRKGLGLGLYICKELVTRQGGKVWVKSALGQGATFSVTLPIFSLPTLLAPTLGKDGHLEDPITLISSSLGSKTGWLSDEVRADHALGVRDLLQRCLQSDLDVLLPKMGVAGAAELFFIVASADDIGGEALAKRIREQWDDCDYIERADLTLTTSHQLVAPNARHASESIDDFLEIVAGNIHDLINEEISSRTVESGQ